MAFFGFGKKKRGTIDFRNIPGAKIPISNRDYNYKEDSIDLRDGEMSSHNKEEDVKLFSSSNNHSNAANMLGFLDSSTSMNQSSFTSSNVVTQVSEISEVKTTMRKLSSQIENSSNDVYKLMQRVELLEKKIQRLEGRG